MKMWFIVLVMRVRVRVSDHYYGHVEYEDDNDDEYGHGNDEYKDDFS